MAETAETPTTEKTKDYWAAEGAEVSSGVVDRLYGELVDLHRRCGDEVLYITKVGNVMRYHPNRYLQALRAARAEGDVIGYCERIVASEEPSGGFNILWVAGRLELTVEAKVVEFHDHTGLFSTEAYDAAAVRLARALAGTL